MSASRVGRDPGHAAGNREHRAVEQRVDADSGDDGVEPDEADQHAVRQARRPDRATRRERHGGQEPRVVAVGIVRGDDDGERHAARNREIEPALLNNQQLPEADDGDNRREREAAGQRAGRNAGGREQQTGDEQRKRRKRDGHEPARHGEREGAAAGRCR